MTFRNVVIKLMHLEVIEKGTNKQTREKEIYRREND
jgi:hypothetical protein